MLKHPQRAIFFLALLALNTISSFPAVMAIANPCGNTTFMYLHFFIALPCLLIQPWLPVLTFIFTFIFICGDFLGPIGSGLWGAGIGSVISAIITYKVLLYLYLKSSKCLCEKTNKRTNRLCISYGILVSLTAAGAVANHLDFPASHPTQQELDKSTHVPALIPEESRHLRIDRAFSISHLWRLHLNEKQLAALAEANNLKPIGLDAFPPSFYRHHPYWWNPSHMPRAHAYATSGYSPVQRGGILLVWDPQTGDTHVEAPGGMMD